jgi:hypothetical protein
MKANNEISPAMPDNEALFTDPFFRRFALRQAAEPLRLSDSVSKRYRFPTFYGDVTCAIGVFLCDYEKAREVLPDPRLRPVRMPRGRAVVTFSSYEYRQVMNVAPYNEVAMTIPVLCEPPFDLPVLPMLLGGLYPGFGYYVFGMPVTSKENQLRGNKIWGLPKVTQEIETREAAGEFVTTAFEASGEPYFELRVPTSGSPADFDVQADLYSKLGGKLLASRTCFKARFNVVKHMAPLWTRGLAAERRYLTLGTTPSAALLRDLGIEEHPFQFRFARGMRAAFDLPHKEFPG